MVAVWKKLRIHEITTSIIVGNFEPNIHILWLLMHKLSF